MARTAVKLRFVLAILILNSIFISGIVIDSSADTVYFKNGKSMEGIIKSEDATSIELELPYGTVKFSKSMIDRIKKLSAEEAVQLRSNWQQQGAQERMKQEATQNIKNSQPRKVELEKQRGHIVVPAKLNKKVDVTLLLDTGASLIVLPRRVGEQLGVNFDSKDNVIQLQLADGRASFAKYFVLKSVQIRGSEATSVGAAVLFDNSASSSIGDGLLGMSFLKNFNFKIDQGRGELILEKIK